MRAGLIRYAFRHDNLGVDALARGDAAIIENAHVKRVIKVAFLMLWPRQKPRMAELRSTLTNTPGTIIMQFIQGRLHFLTALLTRDLFVKSGRGYSFIGTIKAGRYIDARLQCLTARVGDIRAYNSERGALV